MGLLPASGDSFPAPRRDCASAVLPNGNILIHGGGNADLEETSSDGWILDTSATPMPWQSVEALLQLGKRKNHAADKAVSLVLFCFGMPLLNIWHWGIQTGFSSRINIDLPVDVLTSGERSAATDYGIYYVTARVFLQSNIDPFVHGQLYAILPCVRRQTGHVPSGLTTHTKQPTIANKSRGPFSAGVRAVTRTQKLHTPELIFNFKHGFPPLLLLVTY